MKTKIIKTMWALPWCSYGGKSYPSVFDSGPWQICFSKSMCKLHQLDKFQKPVKVKVVIEKA